MTRLDISIRTNDVLDQAAVTFIAKAERDDGGKTFRRMTSSMFDDIRSDAALDWLHEQFGAAVMAATEPPAVAELEPALGKVGGRGEDDEFDEATAEAKAVLEELQPQET